jgi:cystathionine beta-lyase/cystathionine gamma-synthase
MGISRRSFLKYGTAVTSVAGLAAEVEGEVAAPRDDMENFLDQNFKSSEGRHFTSEAIHAGEEEGFSVTPIYQAKNMRGIYQRPSATPTNRAFEAKMQNLEGGEQAVCAPCGMSIITQTHLTFLSAGDRIITHRCVYDNVNNFFSNYLPKWGVEVSWVDMTDLDKLQAALKRPAKIVHFEPYVNPNVELLDAPRIIRMAKEAGAMVIVDNTFLTPFLFQPLRRGADLVVHSATKYICGHGNAMGGVIIGRNELIQKIEATIGVLGGILRPFDAFLLTQGLKTLSLRMQRHCQNAIRVAEFLESHPKVARVRYGGLPSHPGHQIGVAYLSAFGGMLGVEWKSAETHNSFHQRLKMCKPWFSLGDVVTLVSKRSEEPDRGIPKLFTRISIGLEDAEDIIRDFKQALE